MDRREFLKNLGLSSAVIAGAGSLAGCSAKSGALDPSGTQAGEIPKDKMTYRANPKTGEKVSLLGFGMMRLPSVDGSSVSEDCNDEIDQEEVNRLVDYAIEHGVNYFDTSPAYCKGHSEHATGVALARHPREKYFIATKLSNFAPETWSRDASVAMYKNSLKELQTDYIDYMLLHAVGMGDDGPEEFRQRYINNGVLDFLMAERDAGRIRNLGFSYHGDISVFNSLLAQHDKYKWDFVQIQLNYLDWKHAKEINDRNTNAEYLYNELEKRRIPAVIMEPLLGGRLSNLPNQVVADLKQREPERSVASWAFRYCGTMPDVLTVLSGMTRMEHLQDNLRSFCPLKPLTVDEMNFLYATADKMMQFPTIPCNYCQYCMPCPYGLNIPEIFRHYNKCVNEGNVPKSTQDPEYYSRRRAFLVGYDRSVPKLRQASHCIGCGKCIPHCPQEIQIPKELHRIDRYADAIRQNKDATL